MSYRNIIEKWLRTVVEKLFDAEVSNLPVDTEALIRPLVELFEQETKRSYVNGLRAQRRPRNQSR